MSLPAGTKLGPYEIAEALGAGGMGEVYRAHDGRLGRDVAIKVLPGELGDDAERLARFELEARAVAALNHPNLLAIFDIGEQNGMRYIVSELLEGETLRAKLNGAPLSTRRVQEYARQIAEGLAAAHDKGIVHRDLKPENIFIGKDGRAKILDFGLAKQNPLAASAATGATLTAAAQTTPGVVLGTIAYMSPEQVRGTAADHRSDIFSFGAVLHEMLSGERPFRRDTSAETMTAILKEDPPEITSSPGRAISPGIERIMRRCLEKDPEQRFQSARDLAFALEAMSGNSTAAAHAGAAKEQTPRIAVSLRAALGTVALLIGLVAAGTVIAFRAARPSVPVFHQLTSSRGFVRIARFTPDGDTVVFGGAWNGEPMKLFFQRADASGFSPLSIPDADLFAVSSTGELAIRLNRSFRDAYANVPTGTLARVSLSGGSPREVLEGVTDADWSPDGGSFAVARASGSRFRLECPIGKVLYETAGYISHIRFSHRGDKIAFMDHPILGDDRGFVSVIDLTGKRTVLTQEWRGEQGLAWTADDSEIWFSAADDIMSNSFLVLRGVALSGKVRMVFRSPGNVLIQDIAGDGRVLLSADSSRTDINLGEVASGKVADLTWTDRSWGEQISDDGKWIAFTTDSGANMNYDVYIRKTDGSPAIRLGDGNAESFSPDGKWVAAGLPTNDRSLVLLPAGAGQQQVLKSEEVHFAIIGSVFWLPDGKNFVVQGYEERHGTRSYLLSVGGGEPKPITPEDTQGELLSPDGKQLLARDSQGKRLVYRLDGGAPPKAVPGIEIGDEPIQWLRDGRTLLIRDKEKTAISTYQFDIESGTRKPWKRFVPADNVGLKSIPFFRVTPDGSRYLTGEMRFSSTLFVAKGLK